MTTRLSQFQRNAAAACLLIVTAGLLGGCGGSTQSVISTGFPQGAGPFSVAAKTAAGTGSLTLTASDVPSAVFFAAPSSVASSPALTSPVSAAGGSLTYIAGTAYQLYAPTNATGTFPSTVTLKITYPSAGGNDLNTLNIYDYNAASKEWAPVVPAAGGFSSQAGVITTTLTTISGSGLYAVMASAPPTTP